MALQFKRGSSAAWASANTVLAPGQPGLDTTLGRMKYGDGITPWASLGWFDQALYDAITAKRAYLGLISSQAAMLALNAKPGDWLQRTDLANQVFELSAAPSGTLANWKAYPLGSVALIDNLTTGGTGSALTAEQGKTLNLLKAPLANPTFTGTVSGISRAMVGLGNVDNTADANKPVSTPQQTAIDAVRTNLGSVSSQAAMLALSGAKRRDFVTRSDLGGQVFELVGLPPSTLSNWFGFPLPAAFPVPVAQLVPVSGTITLTLDGYRSVVQPYTIAGPTTFVFSNTGQIEGGSINFTLIGNGTDIPSFSGFTLIGGTPVGNTLGQQYEVAVFLGQGIAKYGVVLGSSPDTTAPTVVARSVADGSKTVLNMTFSEPVNTTIAPAASSFLLSGHTSTAFTIVDSLHGNLTFTPALTPGEVVTLGYTQPGSNGLRDVSANANLMASFSGAAVVNNIAATVPATMSAPVATAGNGQISFAFTPPNNGGATIIDYTVTLSGGSTFTGGASPIVATGLTNGTAQTGTIKARNSVGSSLASPASNSVTPAVQAGFVRDYSTKPDSTTSTGFTGTVSTGSAGPLGISGGKLYVPPASNGLHDVFEVYPGGSPNGVLSASFNEGSARGYGQSFRFVDINNRITVYIDNQTFVVKAIVNGTGTNVIVVFNVTGFTSTNNIIETTFNGSTVSCKLNGSAIGSTVTLDAATMTALGSATLHGIRYEYATSDQTTNSCTFVAA